MHRKHHLKSGFSFLLVCAGMGWWGAGAQISTDPPSVIAASPKIMKAVCSHNAVNLSQSKTTQKRIKMMLIHWYDWSLHGTWNTTLTICFPPICIISLCVEQNDILFLVFISALLHTAGKMGRHSQPAIGNVLVRIYQYEGRR